MITQFMQCASRCRSPPCFSQSIPVPQGVHQERKSCGGLAPARIIEVVAGKGRTPSLQFDAEAQEAGGPQNAGRRDAQTAGATSARRIGPLVDGLSVVGWMMGAG